MAAVVLLLCYESVLSVLEKKTAQVDIYTEISCHLRSVHVNTVVSLVSSEIARLMNWC